MPTGEKAFKILMTAYDFRPNLGGVASVAFELASSLKALGAEVRVLAPTSHGPDPTPYTFQVIRKPFSKNSWLASAQFVLEIERQKREWRPDAILHTVWFPEALHALVDRRIPHFQIVHGSEVLESPRTFRKRVRKKLRPLKRQIFKSMAKVFAVSDFTRDLTVKECEIPPSKVKVIPNGVNLNEFGAGEPSPEVVERYKAQGLRVILTLNRLEKYKGNDLLIKALPEILKEVPNALVVMAGTGPAASYLEQLARELGVAQSVRFVGAVPFSERRNLYQLSEIFVLLTRTDWNGPDCEGFGLVLLEAAACGRTCVASNEGGIPNAVINGETGILVSPHDPSKVAHEIKRVLLDAPLREKLETSALKRAQKFSWTDMARNVLKEMADYGNS